MLLIGCAEPDSADPSAVDLSLSVDAAFRPAFEAAAATLPYTTDFDGGPGDWTVRVVEGDTCEECFRLSGGGTDFTVSASDVLGAQYGLTALLEAGGARFFHPFDSWAPPLAALDALDEAEVAPAVATRGLHLHTLHPIEGLDAFWTDPDPARAEAVLDWVVRTRGDYLQWVALDDIQDDDPSAWRGRTQAINDAAHLRGLRTGLGIQLFGASNLQEAFDLLDDPGELDENRAEIEARLAVVTDLGFDHLSLSFGEFFGEDPQSFIDNVDLVHEVATAQSPELTMSSTIHVGDDQRVSWEGEEMIYYFLAQFADPAVVPWVHTVMYYDLYEDAGGAYHHELFDEHRAFLEERIAAGEPVGYHPESAYWVAFDNSVPTWLPLYVRSRWLDLDQLAVVGALDAHVLFSSGWEWGYWQGDYATMRLTHQLRPWEDEVRDMYAPFGEDGATLAELVVAVAEAEHQAFIEQRLTAYVAGRDAIMDAGYSLDIVSQPERPSFADVSAYDAAARADFVAAVVEPLDALAASLLAHEAVAEALPQESRWFREVADGVEVTRLRVAFAAAVWAAVAGDPGRLDEAAALRDEARLTVARRLADFHDPAGATWVLPEWDNPTIYDFGYLRYADELCYWERELAQAREAALGSDEDPPPCGL